MTTVLPGRLITLLRRGAPGARPACVLLPGAGGGLNPYLRLAAHLGATHNVYAVRAAGLLPGEQPETTLAQMADAAVDALAAHRIDPALVFGWSLGGTLGWEVCARLGGDPDLVIVDSSPFPRQAGTTEDERIREVIVRGLGARPDPETVDRVVAVYQAQIGALAAYAAAAPYAGRVLLLMCSDPDITGRDTAVARWRELAADCHAGTLAAGHFEVFDPDLLPQLTAAIDGFVRTEVTT